MEEASFGPLSFPPTGARNRAESPSSTELRTAFDTGVPYSVGIEDEVMLVDPASLELTPAGPLVIGRLADDERFKLELPSSQLEIVTPPSATVGRLAEPLLSARRTLAEAAEGAALALGVPVHPFSPGLGELNDSDRYTRTIVEYAQVARRQLVCALQVHVGIGDADRALAVYNVVRSYLPLLAALAANGPFYEGHDTGLASVRPKLSELLPRQGVPPALASWEQLAEIYAWGATSGNFETPRTWWWELRPHVSYGTLEFRVPDAQSTIGDGLAIAAVIQALVAWLGERHDEGERDHIAEPFLIAENRWSACRHGLDGTMADLQTGRRRATRDCLNELLDTLTPVADRLGCRRELDQARALAIRNGAIAQREVAADGGVRAATAWLAERFLVPPSG